MSDSAGLMIVYGALRSGTTLLRLMLDGHPRLSSPCESDFMFDHFAHPDRMALDADAMKRDRFFVASGMTLPAGEAQDQLRSLACQTRKARDVGIMILHRSIGRALEVFPDTRIIHLLRDPRDVARSSIAMGWAGNVYCGVDHWIRTEDAWTAVQDGLKPGQVLEIRYEELVRAPETVLTRICGFAGVDYAASMLDYHLRSTYSRPDPGKIEQWRKHLDALDLGLLEAKLGARLASRGYATSGHPPVKSTALTDFALRLHSKQKLWTHKIEHFGLADLLMVTVARRMRLPSLAGAARRRIEAKIISRLK